MTELVKRLRTRADEIEHGEPNDGRMKAVKLYREAANRIEELEAELVHSEWLRMRQGTAYQRVGDEIV